jgi:hypothetical protein
MNRDEMAKEFNQSLERLKTDYIDLYCMHGVRDVAKDVTPERMKLGEDLKKQGKIKFFGFSSHENMGECLLAAAKLGGIDGITFMYNYRLSSDEKIKAGIEACFKAGIGLNVIKSQAQGWTSANEEQEPLLAPFVQKGFSLHQARLKAMWANEMIASVCSAMGNLEIMSANVAAAYNKTKLSSEDMHALQLHAQATCSSYCAGCSNICILAMGEDYRIADVMRFMMYHNSYGETDRAREQFAQLPAEIRATVGKIDYTAAERVCPQRLAIARIMREASEILA